MFFYGLSLLAMFENSLVQTLRNAVIIGLTHPVRTLGMFVFTALTFYGILLYVPLAVFLLPGLGAAVINSDWKKQEKSRKAVVSPVSLCGCLFQKAVLAAAILSRA